jgi:hypothetical protein
MSCVILTKYIHFAQTRIFQTTFQKLQVILCPIHPFWFYLYLQCEQMHMIHNTFQSFKNLLHGERGQDIYCNGFTFCSTTWKLFLVQSYHWECTIHGSKGMVVFYCVVCKQSSFSCSVFTPMGHIFFGKIRHYFFTATLSFYSSCMFYFLGMLQYISERPPCSTENCDLQI